jgi:DNA polymerase III alpha subunit
MRPRLASSIYSAAARYRRPFRIPPVEPWAPAERLRREHDAVGFFLSGHPLDDYEHVLKRLRVQRYADFAQMVRANGTGVAKVAVSVIDKSERRTKSGSKMGIVNLSDPSGQFEAILFSEGLQRFRDFLEPGRALVLRLSAVLDGEDVGRASRMSRCSTISPRARSRICWSICVTTRRWPRSPSASVRAATASRPRARSRW